jgi:hypothetical protein
MSFCSKVAGWEFVFLHYFLTTYQIGEQGESVVSDYIDALERQGVVQHRFSMTALRVTVGDIVLTMRRQVSRLIEMSIQEI